jgi:ABC-2 type transport system permease protein
MKYAFLVAWREYVENVKTKGFWIGMFLMPIILFLTAQVPIWLEQKATPIRYFALIDQSTNFAPIIVAALEKAHQRQVLDALNEYAAKNSVPAPTSPEAQRAAATLAQFSAANPQALDAFTRQGGMNFFLEQLRPCLRPGAPDFKEPRRPYQPVQVVPGVETASDFATLAKELKPYLRGDEKIEINGRSADLYAAVLIPRDIEDGIVRPGPAKPAAVRPSAAPASDRQIQYWSTDVAAAKTGGGLAHDIEEAVNAEIRRREYLARGLDGTVVHEVEHTYAPFANLNPKKEAGKEAVNAADVIKQWAPSGFVYLLWLSIFIVTQMLLNNTIEEKSNRIIEVLLSSVTPGELMMGKLFGIGAVGLTTIAAWLASLFGILSWRSGGSPEIAGQLLVVLRTSYLIPLFCVYFLLGYFLYSTVILSIGSVCNSIKEAQSYMGVVTLVMMVPLMTMTFIPKDPNGAVARLLSWIPIYTPFAMMNRADADPPLIDLVGTLVLLAASTGIAVWMAGKIFRIGILRTGQPPKVVEMLRWAMRKSG